MNDMLVTVDAAWLCAAEVDVEREEMERLEVLARRQRNQVRGKYELESASGQLDVELKKLRLERKKKATQVDRERTLQLPPGASSPLLESKNQLGSPPPLSAPAAKEAKAIQKQKKVASVYARENLRLAMLMRDKALQERVKKCVSPNHTLHCTSRSFTPSTRSLFLSVD